MYELWSYVNKQNVVFIKNFNVKEDNPLNYQYIQCSRQEHQCLIFVNKFSWKHKTGFEKCAIQWSSTISTSTRQLVTKSIPWTSASRVTWAKNLDDYLPKNLRPPFQANKAMEQMVALVAKSNTLLLLQTITSWKMSRLLAFTNSKCQGVHL